MDVNHEKNQIFQVHILTSSTIDKKLVIYTKLKNLEYELEIDKKLENFESNFEVFLSI